MYSPGTAPLRVLGKYPEARVVHASAADVLDGMSNGGPYIFRVSLRWLAAHVCIFAVFVYFASAILCDRNYWQL